MKIVDRIGELAIIFISFLVYTLLAYMAWVLALPLIAPLIASSNLDCISWNALIPVISCFNSSITLGYYWKVILPQIPMISVISIVLAILFTRFAIRMLVHFAREVEFFVNNVQLHQRMKSILSMMDEERTID